MCFFLIKYWSEIRLASHSCISMQSYRFKQNGSCSEILIKIPSIKLCGNAFMTSGVFLFAGEEVTADTVRLMCDFSSQTLLLTSRK